MKYLIRTAFDREAKPCNKAFKLEAPTGKGEFVWAVNVETLEDLNSLVKECKHPIIVGQDSEYLTLAVYDFYIE